jgi:hypothetical protein
VTVFRAAGLKCQPDSFGEFLRLFVGDGCRMQHHGAATAFQKLVELLILLRGPVVVPKVKDYYINVLEALRPFPRI